MAEVNTTVGAPTIGENDTAGLDEGQPFRTASSRST